jgi:ketosteroid isomerase-like protein
VVKIVWFLLLLLTVAAGDAQSGSPDPQQNRVLALENAWNQALQQKDARAMEPLMGAEVIVIDYDGTMMNKAQYMTRVRVPPRDLVHIVSDSMQVQIYGRSAIVMGIYHEKGMKNGRPYLRSDRFIDTWINRNGAWLCVASQSTPIAR